MFGFFKKKKETPENKIKNTIESFYGYNNVNVKILGNSNNIEESVEELLNKLENKLKKIVLENFTLKDVVEFLEIKINNRQKRNEEKGTKKSKDINVVEIYELLERINKLLSMKNQIIETNNKK